MLSILAIFIIIYAAGSVSLHQVASQNLCKQVFLTSNQHYTSCSTLGARLLLLEIAAETNNEETKSQLKEYLSIPEYTDEQIKANLAFTLDLIANEHNEEHGLHVREFVARYDNNGIVWRHNVHVQCKLAADANANDNYGQTPKLKHITGSFLYGKDSATNSEFVQIPCENLSNVKLYLVFPTGDNTLKNLTQHIHQQNAESFKQYGSFKSIHIIIPEDGIIDKSQLDLKTHLNQLGVNKLFHTENIVQITQEITLEITIPYNNTVAPKTAEMLISLNEPYFIVVDFEPDTLFITKVDNNNTGTEDNNSGYVEPITAENLADVVITTDNTNTFTNFCNTSATCDNDEKCDSMRCIKVCPSSICGPSAQCYGVNHVVHCNCPGDWGGDPTDTVGGCHDLIDEDAE